MISRAHQIGQPPEETAAEVPAPIVFGAPLIGLEEIAEVVDTLRSGWLGTGPKTERFEHEFADYVGTRFAVATNSCTAGLHLALDALGIGPGDEVVTSALTFVATANAIEHVGARPVFVDVRRDDGNIDPAAAARAIGPRTAAIVPVHYAGVLADVAAIRAAAGDLPVIADAAHAVEGRTAGGDSSAGAGATCAAYSFYATKNLVTAEGGMLVTDDARIADLARVRRLHGLDFDAWDRYAGRGGRGYDVVHPGFKYNMTDLQASLGIHQLARIERSLARRAVIWERYNQAFTALDGVELPAVSRAPDAQGRHSRHLYTLWIDWEALDIDRGAFVARMAELGVGTGWHFPSVHLHTYYRDRYGFAPGAFPVAEEIAARTVSLPLSAGLTDGQVERVVAAVMSAVGGGR
jgi:dTDP-4-amino-4,6-dideoxygalactose transaminase